MDKRVEHAIQLAAVSTLVAGCFIVLRPFLTAILLAAVVCIATWPLYRRLLRGVKGRQTLAALLATLLLVVVVIFPFAVTAYSLADDIAAIYSAIRHFVESAPPDPPEWLKRVPVIGDAITDYWHEITASREKMLAFAKSMLEPLRRMLVAAGILLGRGVTQMGIAALVSFFFYRDGPALMGAIHRAVHRVIGGRAEGIIATIAGTVRAVMYGMLGTAFAQGIVAAVGFAVAGVPAPLLLGLVTMLFSLIPVGPPVIWIGAAIWLFHNGLLGWSIFMLLWGFFAISSVDNVVKPLLISRGADLPFILGLFGVIGGVLAFGFVGVFIGPTLLAVGLSLMKEWAAPDGKTSGPAQGPG